MLGPCHRRAPVAIQILWALGLPAIVVSLVLLDMPHIALAVLIVVYLAGTIEMARQAFNSAIDQIRLKEQFDQTLEHTVRVD